MTFREYTQFIEDIDFDRMLEQAARKRKAKRFVAKVLGIAAAVGVLIGVKANAAEYPGLLKVKDVSKSGLVTGIDANGNLWGFMAEGDDWEVDDLCAVIYEDCGTKEIKDDRIVSTQYVGYVELYN